MTRTRALPISFALACALVLGACSDQPDAETSTAAQTSATPTSGPAVTTEAPDGVEQTTTAPPESSAEEQDQADVEETLQAFNDALVEALTGQESIEGIYPYSRDAAREQWVTQVMAYDAQQVTFSGATKMEVLEISIEGDTAEAVACRDVSDVAAVNADGESIITDERLDRSLQDFHLERDSSAERGWYVVSDVSRNEPCDD